MARWRRWPETYAKEVLGTMLELRGPVITEYEIERGKERRLRADMHFEPDPARPRRGDLGVLDRIADLGPCIIELFSAPPRRRYGRECLNKYLLWQRQLGNRARRHRVPTPETGLWMVAPGRPQMLIAALGMKPMHGWPTGFWRMGGELAAHLIVVRDLPALRETLPLRLLNNHARLHQAAVAELDELPGRSRLRQSLMPLVLAWSRELGKDLDEGTMRYFAQTKTRGDLWVEKIRSEGMERGLERGLERGKRELLRKLLTLRFGALPADAEQRLEKASSAELELWAERVLTASSLDAALAD